jgi:hypothetical protein
MLGEVRPASTAGSEGADPMAGDSTSVTPPPTKGFTIRHVADVTTPDTRESALVGGDVEYGHVIVAKIRAPAA